MFIEFAVYNIWIFLLGANNRDTYFGLIWKKGFVFEISYYPAPLIIYAYGENVSVHDDFWIAINMFVYLLSGIYYLCWLKRSYQYHI